MQFLFSFRSSGSGAIENNVSNNIQQSALKRVYEIQIMVVLHGMTRKYVLLHSCLCLYTAGASLKICNILALNFKELLQHVDACCCSKRWAGGWGGDVCALCRAWGQRDWGCCATPAQLPPHTWLLQCFLTILANHTHNGYFCLGAAENCLLWLKIGG